MTWEVLNGVGVDGVGVIFPFFYAFFPFFLRIFPLFLRISLLLLKDKGKQQQFTAKMGNFTPTPSAPTPCKTSRMTKNHGSSGVQTTGSPNNGFRNTIVAEIIT